MDPSGFRTNISFAERMNRVTKMQVGQNAQGEQSELISSSKTTYLAFEPNIDPKGAQAKARSFENAALRASASKEEYEQICLHEVERLEKDLLNGIERAEIVDTDHSSPTTQIGPYQAAYHQSGLFSTVYKAREPGTSNLLALKLTIPSQCTAPHDPLREARILAAATHEHILPLLRTFPLAGGKFTLVFPFLPFDLDTLLHDPSRPPLSSQQTKAHLHDLFSGLAHIHSLGIIHRDIKPSNILSASPDGPAYIADFGIGWMNGDEASEPIDEKITDVGTTAYRPPELLFGHKAYGCALDLWAAGCVVAEVVAGKPHPSLFDSGPLGSDLALIQSVFRTLGTPTDGSWPVCFRVVSPSLFSLCDERGGDGGPKVDVCFVTG
ncbi:MAG: hypothetical protein Q9196_004103 [Gyalolechia fulgens]